MSVLIQGIINSGRPYILRKSLNISQSLCKCMSVRKISDAGRKYKTFDEVVSQRRDEARRSIVVQVNSESSYKELFGYCTRYASVTGVHHYQNGTGEHFMLIEFESEENVRDILHSCSAHQKDSEVMALQSPFLWFRAITKKKEAQSKKDLPDIKLVTQNGTSLDEDQLFAELLACESVTDQIQLLYDKTTLNDLGIRLRFMVARQLEIIFSSLYANIAVRPFGSSVNGFGKMGCDLDLVLTNNLTDEMLDPEKRLVYQEKKCEGSRSPWQRHMELVGELLDLRVPGATRVQRILHARVPIVKYAHDLAGLDVDLCYSNMSGVYMSELLWLYGSLDCRVRPLTFAVRKWAQNVGLTNPHPGRWITNFPLTLLVLFFLQQKRKEGFILPTVKYLVRQAGKEDTRLAEDNLNCTFLRDLNELPTECYGQCSSDLQTLLLQFFEFYSQFDFSDKAVSINEGTAVRKPNSLPLYIVNPLEQSLNVSRNVSYEECERFKLEVRNAAWQLESCTERNKGDDWGLLALIEKRSTRGLKKLLKVGNSHRLVSVKDLFDDQDSSSDGEEKLSSKLKRLTKSNKEIENSVKEMKVAMIKEERKEQKMKFKNSQIAKEVFRIMRDKIV